MHELKIFARWRIIQRVTADMHCQNIFADIVKSASNKKMRARHAEDR
jgi:hypothetical protein